MAVRKQRSTTTKEIMERDIDLAVKKAKIRFRDDVKFYILKYNYGDSNYYFASLYPEIDPNAGKGIFYQEWIFTDKRWRKN